MAKVVNVIDNGDGNYEVTTMKNTIRFKIGQFLTEEDVNNLIAVGYDVNVKGPKEPKGE